MLVYYGCCCFVVFSLHVPFFLESDAARMEGIADSYIVKYKFYKIVGKLQ